jgi:hypothetical protein
VLFERDFLKRQIRALALLVARLVGSKRGAADTIEELRRAASDALGVDAEVLARVDVATAASLLADPERIQAYAFVLAEEADLCADAAGADAARRRSLALFREAFRRAYG